MTNEELMRAHFWQSYLNIDIWRTLDTTAGKATFFFWYDGKIYEQDSEAGILTLAKVFTDEKIKNQPKGKLR